jgi:hypothetical protein
MNKIIPKDTLGFSEPDSFNSSSLKEEQVFDNVNNTDRNYNPGKLDNIDEEHMVSKDDSESNNKEGSEEDKIDESNKGVTLKEFHVPLAIINKIRKTVGNTFLSESITRRLVLEYFEVSEYEVKFSLHRFIKMFITTFSHFCFGILTTIFIMLIDGYGFAWNQYYWGLEDLKFVILNYLDHLALILSMVLIMVFPTKHVKMIDLVFPIITYFSRSFIIAWRYSLISDARWEILHKKNRDKWIKSDFIKHGWEDLQLTTLLREIKATKYRLQIDDDEFKFTFLERLNKEQHDKLTDFKYYQHKHLEFKNIFEQIRKLKKSFILERNTTMKLNKQKSTFFTNLTKDRGNISDNEILKLKSSLKIGNEKALEEDKVKEWVNNSDQNILNLKNSWNYDEMTEYKGESILREICILEAQRNNGRIYLILLIWIRILMISATQLREFDDVLKITFADGILYFLLILSNCSLHYINLTFILTGLTDFKRKLFYMKMMSALIDPENSQEKFIYSHFLPTIDFTCSRNLERWLLLREWCLDFGRKYTMRIFLFCSVFLVFYGSFAFIITLENIGIFHLGIPWNVQIIAYYDISMILGIIFNMLKVGAKINGHFVVHKGILLTLKRNSWMVWRDFERFESKQIFGWEGKRVIRNKLREKTEEERRHFVEDLITTIDVVTEKLDYCEQHCQLRMLGIKWTNELINSIYTGVISYAFLVIKFVHDWIKEI